MPFCDTDLNQNKSRKFYEIAIVRFLFLLIPSTFLVNTVLAQKWDLSFDKLTVETGLSQSSVISITQDSMGFMWFGTKDGLNRYDSRQFEVFKSNIKDSTSLSSSQNINALLTDNEGNLWVGTQEGLNKYLPETKTFQRFLYQANDKFSLSNNTVRSLYEDKEGSLWVGTENGLNRLNKNGKFDRFLCKGFAGQGLVSPIVKAIFEDSKGVLWVGTQSGLLAITAINNRYRFKTYFHNNTDASSISDNDINAIVEDKEKNLWVGTHFKGLDVLLSGTSGFKHYTSSNSGLLSNVTRKITLDKTGNLWIATLNGISIYDPSSNTFKNQIHNPENVSSINQNSVYDVYEDVAGSIWAGTYYGGVNVYHPNAIPFKVYKHYSYKNSLSSNIISALREDKKGNLWIGTEAEGLNYFDRKTNEFSTFKSNDGKNSISSNLIKALTIDQKENLWIAAYEGGLDYYDTKTGIFKTYLLPSSTPLSGKRVTSLVVDWRNRVWAGSRGNGLYLFNGEADSFVALKSGNANFFLSALNIVFLFEDKQNTLWVASDEGLFYLRKSGRKFIRLTLKKENFFNQISAIGESKDGKLLFGTYNDGLAIYNQQSKKIIIYKVKNGLPSNNIAGVVEDDQQHIWVSTDKGIAKLSGGGFKIYDRNDGLPGKVFNYHSVLKDSKGVLFFGGYNGLVSFLPSDVNENKIAPKVVFTYLRLFNRHIAVDDESGILPKSLNKIDELTLTYQQNVFSIDFSALSYVKSKKNKYAYKLDGFESEWNEVDEPTATFTNLPNGTYTLLVKGSNNDGVFSEQPSELRIIIKPPFWRTWWAYLFYLALSIALIYLVLRFLLIRALLKREHDVHQMKLEFFTNVSHEIRTPLTLILGPLEKMILDTNDNFKLNKQLLSINKNAKRLMRLVNELMDFRKIESRKMKLNLSKDDIVSFVNEIYLSFQQLAQQKEVVFTFTSNQKNIDLYFDKSQLEKVIINLLSNAFKFTADENPEVSIEISQQEEQVFIRIKDNGEGIAQENRTKLFTHFYQAPSHQQRNLGTGIGLAFSKSIAKLHHGDLILEDSEDVTSFCLSMRLGNMHYKPEDVNDTLTTAFETSFVPEQIDLDVFIKEPKKKGSISSNLPLLLVVDDNAEIKEFIVNILSPFYQVIEASDGKEALGMAFEKLPDVVISDVMMPIIDGFELCSQLKADIRTSHIPIVLLTARSSEFHELEGLKTGADAYLTKPFNTEKLKLTVDNLIALHQHMREKFSQQFSLQPTELKIESSDEEFLNKVLALLEDNISNSEFNVNLFASKIGMSTPVFYKKINALTGLTVNNFIKSIRLKRGFQLLQQKAGNVSEIAYMVGFNDPKYFSKEFKKQYGKSPSAYSEA